MKYKGYKIEMNLDTKAVRFYNDIDDNIVYVNLFVNKPLKFIESFVLKLIDKRVEYLSNAN
jgi:hypothetical protein